MLRDVDTGTSTGISVADNETLILLLSKASTASSGTVTLNILKENGSSGTAELAGVTFTQSP